MRIQEIIFITVHLLLLASYLYVETGPSFRNRVINKSLLASCFLVYGSCVFFTQLTGRTEDLLLYGAVVFSFLGDVLLLFSFMKGGISFIVGNFLYTAFHISHRLVTGGIKGWEIIMAIVLFLLIYGYFMYLALIRKYYDFGSRGIFKFYMATIIVHGSLGIVTLFRYGDPRMMLIGIGEILFMISDFFLAAHYFRDRSNKLHLRLNSFTYFIGMMLIVLGMRY